MKALLASFLCALLLAVLPVESKSHALDPGYLELTEEGEGQWRVTWRIPNVSGRPMAIAAQLPEVCSLPPALAPRFDGSAWIETWQTDCSIDLAGQTLAIEGLERTRTDVLLRYAPLEAAAQTYRLTPSEARLILPADPSSMDVFLSYSGLGITHIWEGPDHLLFVFCLVLLISGWRKLVLAVTAFTVAHSLTLVSATLELVDLPGPPVEAVIALSIVFLAYELALPPDKRDPLSTKAPWLVAFGFGLIHGLGFAGALSDIGLPQGDVPLALFAFNIGVELGQLIFVALALSMLALLRGIVPTRVVASGVPLKASSYLIGSLAAFWVLERVSAF